MQKIEFKNTLESVTALNIKDTKAGFDYQWLFEHFNNEGLNDPFAEGVKTAMWITPNGKLIDGLFVEGLRTLDHTNALLDASVSGIVEALKNGAVRVMHEYKTIETFNGTLEGLTSDATFYAALLINMYDYELVKNESAE